MLTPQAANGGAAVNSTGTAASESLANPVLNGPYDPPSQHFEIGAKGPTGAIKDGRRPSESYIPIAPVRKRKAGPKAAPVDEEQLTLGLTHELVQTNPMINGLRRDVELWRMSGVPRRHRDQRQVAAALV